ncbi:hypothetical protein [Knoellia koreensis]|uniref:Uncharacterized protein n=1 Tax=Knoellia koreensis TaxID=2730921 RepID=A0A849HCB6_9MICO|nr:hypothetical protein [Knoellia sp. DB2414S]NNM44689.1 hypothetical protein [Knoellia sp. DB2414S]
MTEQYPEQQAEHDSVADRASEDESQQADGADVVAGKTGMPQGERDRVADQASEDEPQRESGFDAETGTTPDPQREPAPETGDIVIDSALRDLQSAPADDLDAQIAAGQQVHRTLQARLSDLGGE